MQYARISPGKGFRPIRGILYYTQRLATPQPIRRLVIALLGAVVRCFQSLRTDLKSAPPASLDLAKQLKENGMVSLGVILDEQKCKEIHAFLAHKPLSDRDRTRPAFFIDEVPTGVRVADYELHDIVHCPHILELANSPTLLALAASYIGCKPTISALGLRWSFPRAEGDSVLQAFHRDSEDWRYFKVLVYLTDVDEDAGPHVYVLGSHRTTASIRLRFKTDEETRALYGAEQLHAATGPAGYGFAVDTAGVHKGAAPSRRPRLMLQIQYSLLPCFAYEYAPVPNQKAERYDPYVNRLLVQ